MGVRGLTTFIAKNANQYLEWYKLSETYLILDGYNIACQLYKWHCVRNDCFGGDYDKYSKVVFEFFKLLSDCKITPIVIFDGGYEDQKINTVYMRMKNKIQTARHLNSTNQGSKDLFPLFLKDLFVSIVLKLNLKAARCEFEADYEIACIAQNLNCPILSYDSDFYIFDVAYIPFNTLELTKYKSGGCNYLKCKVFRIERLFRFYKGLTKETLPLLATLLGNDYVKKAVFRKFLQQIKLAKRKHVRSKQQRTIPSLIAWMQNETFASALEKILGRLKKNSRRRVASKIRQVTRGYLCKGSVLLPYLDIEVEVNEPSLDSNSPLSDENASDDEVSGESEEEENSDGDDGSSASVRTDNETSSVCEDDLDQIPVEEDVQVKDSNIPKWFLDKFRQCRYPPCFMDMLVRRKYYCLPQIEDYSNPSAHHIIVKLLGAINKILLSGSSKSLIYITRNEAACLKFYFTPECNLNLPKLTELQDLTLENSKSLLLEILQIDAKQVTFLNPLPKEWQLYILGIIYWIRQASPKIERHNLAAILLCMLVINRVDPLIGFCRSTTKFYNKFEGKLKLISEATTSTPSPLPKDNFKDMLKDISYNESVLCLKELIDYFQMDFKMTTNSKMFSSRILHCYAQLQSCLLHVQYLNMLLNDPFANFLISDLYDGTFIYNMTVNLDKRTDVDGYVNLLLKQSPSIANCYNWLIKEIFEVISDDIVVCLKQKRKRKKKNKTISEKIDECFSDIDRSSDTENVIDMNNKFSILNLVH